MSLPQTTPSTAPRSAAPPARLSRAERTALRRWGAAVVVWGAAVLGLSLSGLLSGLSLLVVGPLIIAATVVPLLVVSRSGVQWELVRRIDLAHLTWFNIWRVGAAAAFFAVGARGLLPERFVLNAGWGDLIAGVAAPLLVLAGRRLAGRARVRAYTAFHVFSFGDFVLAVGTGVTFSLLGDPLMSTLLGTPMALIPLWGVPLTGAISLLALHRLMTQRA